MKFHREGNTIIAVTILLLAGINLLAFWLLPTGFLYFISPASLVVFLLIIQFFRVPSRPLVADEALVICPADGKVVVIEETEESEFLKDRRIQVSIFMSPVNVHVNWFPINGTVKYYKYHPGKYLVAWHPKSSTLNERTTVVVENSEGIAVLFRQIAGAVARRIVCYAREGMPAEQGSEFGFIKFGSRVDVFLPLGSDIQVNIDQMVTGSQTVLAILPTGNS